MVRAEVYLVALAAFLGCSYAQRPAFGRCPDVTAKEDFDLAKDATLAAINFDNSGVIRMRLLASFDIEQAQERHFPVPLKDTITKDFLILSKSLMARCEPPNWVQKVIIQFTGEWVEVERSFYLFESSTSCTKLNFTTFLNDTMKVEVQYKVPWRGTTSVSSYVVNDVSSTPGVFHMVLSSNLPSMIARLAPGSGKYIVIDTDYKDFALIYSCTDLRLVHADFIWVLGRTADISVDARTIVYSTLDKNKINRDRLLLSPNRDCS